MSLSLKCLVPSLLFSLATASASAASFDCTQARTPVETMICADASLSRLDSRLGADYAAFLQAHAGARDEKSLQLAWLAARNACRDAACVAQAYQNRIAELRARAASASPLAGFWKLTYSCAGATDLYAERCKQGDRDVYELSIMVQGSRVCILHAATAHLGNRVDEDEGLEPSMTGVMDAAGNATVHYRSAWEGTGTATLRVEGGALHWKVTSKVDGQSSIPDEAVLARVAAGPFDRMPECTGRY